jgi:dsRNA-specific ribonuclease
MMPLMRRSATTEGSDSLKEEDKIPALSYNPIHIEDRIDVLTKTIQATQGETPDNNTRLLTKLDRWLVDLGSIQERLKRIKSDLVPDLERIFELDFKNEELFQVTMFQPSTKNIFMELETQYRRSENDPLGSDGFAQMINLGEMAKVLALVGDAVISSAVLQHLWKPHLGDAGKITQRKAEIVSNSHMAKLCDKWNLYEYRIHFDPDPPSKVEMDHDKGTLVEAVYGIIYLEFEYKMVLKKVTHLINTQ